MVATAVASKPGGRSQHRCAAETVADQQRGGPCGLAAVSAATIRSSTLEEKLGVGELALAVAQPGEVEAQHGEALRDEASLIRDAAATSLEHVKQCAKSAYAEARRSGRSSSASRRSPSDPVKLVRSRRGGMDTPVARWPVENPASRSAPSPLGGLPRRARRRRARAPAQGRSASNAAGERVVELRRCVDADARRSAQLGVGGEVGVDQRGLPDVELGGALLLGDLAERAVVEQHVADRDAVLHRRGELGQVLAETAVAADDHERPCRVGGPGAQRRRQPEADRAEVARHQHRLVAGHSK